MLTDTEERIYRMENYGEQVGRECVTEVYREINLGEK